MAVKQRVFAIVALLLAAGLVLSTSSRSQPASTPVPKAMAKPRAPFKWPDPLTITTGDVGSANYNMGAAFADAMLKNGTTMRIVPVGTDPGRISLLTGGRAYFGYLPSATSYAAFEGTLDFAQIIWGPQPLMLAQAGIAADYSGLITAKDANIKTWTDAKGKRIAVPTGSANSQLIGAANLAFGGLTWKDVVIVSVPSFAASGRAVIEGKADAAVGGSMTPWTLQLAASPRGVYYPPMPHNDVEGWKRVNTVAPFFLKVVATKGGGIDAPIEAGTYSFANVTVADKADADLVYNMAKAMAELYPVYKGAVAGIEQFDPERLNLRAHISYHPGAIRYYKEIGKWTAEDQKNNDRLLARAKVLAQAWEKAVAEAASKKTSSKDFPALWLKVRADSLKAAAMEVLFE